MWAKDDQVIFQESEHPRVRPGVSEGHNNVQVYAANHECIELGIDSARAGESSGRTFQSVCQDGAL